MVFFGPYFIHLNKRRKKAVVTNHKYTNYFQTSYDREVYYGIRKMSMKKGVSMQDIVRLAVSQYLEREGEIDTDDEQSDEQNSKYVSKRKHYFK